MKHTICYISNVSENLTETKLEELFSFILAKNPLNNITGILLFNNGFFLQVLEGEKDILKNLIKSIKLDTRHNHILIVLDEKIESCVFDNYNARFSILKSKTDLENLNIYLSKYDANDRYPNNIKNLIKPFLM